MACTDNGIADAALQHLWAEHSAMLFRLATVLVGPQDAQDVAVDAFLRVASAVSPIRDPRAYLARAVVNRAHDLRRANERRWRRDLASIGPASTGASDTFVDVRRAVAELSLAQRSAVYFVYWEDCTERQTAALLGVSPGTVRRHLVRARDHLRKALQ